MRQRLLFVALIVSLAALAGMVIAVGSLDQGSSWNDPVQQWASTIKFSHKQHVQEVGAECSTCHAAAQTSENANDLMLPKHEECGTCHSDEVENNCQFCHLDPDNPVAFAAPKRDLRFSHKLHVDTNKMECATCHAGIAQSEKPSLANLPVMATCTTCHNNVQAKGACESCHFHPETLVPLSHQQVAWAKEHKRLIRVEGTSNDCAVCHTDNFCQSCHAEATTQITRGAPTRGVPENRPAPDGRQPLVKQRVHNLNYVFTHALDFRSKQADCYSCHNQQTFCSDCHARNQDAGFAAPMPLSHRAPDFVRLGKGLGGGQHAVLARRDMESCASCHDVEGRDPKCVLCHSDLAPKGKNR
ncbi:MAG: cytochrome c3 family protein [candidate division KSB1 bacterium]|nr:cytochrome c3 family protein [candidate division KSB1 bacterium]MDZ7304378.1 cytochrome c3 family protein [candidate division KSB1 bacterium]MDZ7313527.1 cytochrome c3 family protein [candidate division KSB1 bacterium]